MSEEYRRKQLTQWTLFLIAILGSIMIVVSLYVVYGQEPDYRFSCSFADHWPFNTVCQKQINLVKLILKIHIIQCEVDEAICVLGHPDADNDDNGEEP